MGTEMFASFSIGFVFTKREMSAFVRIPIVCAAIKYADDRIEAADSALI